MHLRKLLTIILFLMPLFIYSQQNRSINPFFLKVKENTEQFNGNEHFRKATLFFLQRSWDSTLVYTEKQLNLDTLKTRQNNYAHFFRGYSFHRKRLFEQAKKEFVQISKEFDFYDRIDMYLGEITLEQREFKVAINYFNKVLSKDTDDLIGIKKGSVENNIGLCYLHLKKYVEAENYLLKSIKTFETKNDTIKLLGSYGNLAAMYYEQYRDNKAILYFQKAYTLTKGVDNYELKQNAAKNMAVVEENRNDFQKALLYRKEYEQWKDSLNNQNKIYETAQLEKKIAVAQKQEEVNVLEAENKTKAVQRNGSIISAGILLLLLGITFYFYREKIKGNAIISEQKERLNELNTTKDKLFSIVSHDLRSSVNAIKSSNKKVLYHLETENAALVKETLQQNSAIVNGAYRLLDNLLNWALLQTKQSYFKINDLQLFKTVTHVAYNYIPLMDEKKISFENQVDKKHVVEADQESLKIMIRNLLDNAIKFSKSSDRIKVYSKEQGAYYDLIVEDSGMGMDEDTKEELLKHTQLLSKKKHEDSIGTGLGLHLVKSMIIKNQGKFNIESELGKGTKIIISLPKNK